MSKMNYMRNDFLSFIYFIYLYMCVSVCGIYVWVPAEPRAGVAGGCVLPTVGAGNQTPALC